MPIGQGNTVWFKELKEILRERWKENLSISEQFILVSDLDCKLNQIRKDGNMIPPMMWCPHCKRRERSRFLQVSITGMYYALKGMEVISDVRFKKLIKDWKAYSKLEKINTYGNPIEIKTTENKNINKIHEA
jgi:hypothetical protein